MKLSSKISVLINRLKTNIRQMLTPKKRERPEKATSAPAHRVRYEVDPRRFVTELSMVLMAGAIVFRLIGCWGLWKDSSYAVPQIVLPVICAGAYIVLLLLLGKRLIEATVLPVIVGAAFFIMTSVDGGVWSLLLTILYSFVAVVAYCGTMFGVIGTKWYLAPLFGLPIAYRILVRDIAALRDTENPLTFIDGMQEMSVICILASLLLLVFALKKKQPKQIEDTQLPSIKAPEVISPELYTEPSGEEI